MKKGWRIFFAVIVIGVVGTIVWITLHHVRMNRIVEGIGKPELATRIAASRKMMRMGRRPTKVLGKQARAVADNVVWALETTGEERDIRSIAMIARDLGSQTARDSLVRMGEKAVPVLVEILQQDRRYYDNRLEAAEARAFAAEMLGELKATTALTALTEALDDEYTQARLAAAGALVQIGEPTALQAVVTLMQPYQDLLHNRYRCWVKADAEEKIRELDEANNNAAQPLLLEITPLEYVQLARLPVRIQPPEEQEAGLPSREEMLTAEARRARQQAITGGQVRLKRGLSDLIITDFQVEQPVQPPYAEGEPVTFRVTVKNQGEGDLGRDFMVGLYAAAPPPAYGKVDRRAVAGYDFARQGKIIRSGEEQTVSILHVFSNLEHYRIKATAAFLQVPDQMFVPDVIQAMQDPSWVVRANSVRILGLVGRRSSTSAETRSQIVQTLVDSLQQTDENVRYAAAEALGVIGEPSAGPALISSLSDPSWLVRQAATRSLRQLANPGLIPLLEPLLQSEEPSVRLNAYRILHQIGPPDGHHLVLRATADADAGVRATAISELFPDLVDGERLTTLAVAFGDPHAHVRAAAVRVLATWADPTSRDLLMQQGLADSSGEVRAEAARGLGLMADPTAIPALIELSNREAGDYVGVPAGQTVDHPEEHQPTDKEARAAAVEALGRLGGKQVAAPIIAALDDGNWKVRLVAIRAAGELGLQDAVSKLVTILKDEAALISVRIAAAEALRRLRAQDAVEPFVDLLNHANFQMKIIVSAGLVEMGDRRGRKTLAEHVRSKDVSVRREAAVQVAKMDPSLLFRIRGVKPRKHDGLVMLFEDLYRYGWSVYPFTVEAFLRIGPYDRLLQRLQQELKSQHPLVRAAALETLSRLGDQGVVPALMEALQAEHDFLRQKAAEALGTLKRTEAADALKAVAGTDVSEPVREAARRSLRQMGVWL